MENKKLIKLNIEDLDNVVGGAAGQPVPGAEVYNETEEAPRDAASGLPTGKTVREAASGIASG